MAAVHLSAANEQAFDNSAHCELKIFLWVQSAKVSPLTRWGLFFLLQGSQGWKLPASQRGALKPRWHRRGGRSLRSWELFGLKSGCQSAVIAQWEWAPPLGQSANQRAAINKLSTLSPKPVRLEPQGARSLNFPKHCPLLSFFFPSLVRVCRNRSAVLSHIPGRVISLKAIWALRPLYISPGLPEYVCVHFPLRPTCTDPLCFLSQILTSSVSIGYFGESKMMSFKDPPSPSPPAEAPDIVNVTKLPVFVSTEKCVWTNFTAECMSHKDSYMRHLVRRAAGDTEATRSTCERLLERKISTQPFREEVPRKTEPMNRDEASVCMCTIGWKRACLHVRVGVGSGGGPAIVSLAFRCTTTHMFPLWQYCGSDGFSAIMLHKHAADALINHWGAELRLLSFRLQTHVWERKLANI